MFEGPDQGPATIERSSMSRPSMGEVKSEGQPRWVIERVNDEHLFGRLYMRKISPRATWVLARMGWSPNAVTLAFIVCGVAAGVVIAFGGLATAIIAAVLVQLGLLFDCSDGELARLTKRTSASGIYLDRIGHYLCETAMLIGLGLRAQGHLTTSGRYVTAGLAAAVLAVLVKAETDNVVIARVVHGLPAGHADEALQPRGTGLATVRRAASLLKIHRIIQAIELSVLVVIAAIADEIRGGLLATRVLLITCLIIAAVMVLAHLAAILASRRLS
jgi:phosphatidylglycerophosphate synthase